MIWRMDWEVGLCDSLPVGGGQHHEFTRWLAGWRGGEGGGGTVLVFCHPVKGLHTSMQ